MDIKIYPSKLAGTVKAIPSKSQAHRALICSALSDIPAIVEYGSSSADIDATVACLAELKKDAPILKCRESGSTFRFLLPITAALGLNAVFVLEGRLPQRPLSPLYEELQRHGCHMSPQGSKNFEISGQLTPGSYQLNAGVSSQFISGLLFALPMLNGDSTLRLTGKMESVPYIDMTLSMLEQFKIKIDLKKDTFFIAGNQTYYSPDKVNVEGDWSNAAFWLCADAIHSGGINCIGLNPQSKQGDRKVIEILKLLETEDSVNINASNVPDLVPVLSVAAAAKKGITTFFNAGRLRIKESDRLSAVTDLITRLGGNIIEKEDGLVIHGGVPLKGGTVSGWGDHRIIMSAAIAATICENSVTIQGAEAVNKSYPGFFDDLRSLGGNIIFQQKH